MLYDVEKELGSFFSKVFSGDVKDLNKAFVNKSSWEVMVNLVVLVAGVLDKNGTALRAAAVSIEELNLCDKISVQKELIRSEGSQIETVQATVKSEVRSFSDVIKQSSRETRSCSQTRSQV